jgi:8-oxo-dGTP pyrophosphatase MutT (NUDIX family)
MQEYGKAHEPWHIWIVPMLQRMRLRELMEETGLDRRTIQRLRNRRTEPRPVTEKTLIRVVGSWARRQLLAERVTAPRGDELACRAWIEHEARKA